MMFLIFTHVMYSNSFLLFFFLVSYNSLYKYVTADLSFHLWTSDWAILNKNKRLNNILLSIFGDLSIMFWHLCP